MSQIQLGSMTRKDRTTTSGIIDRLAKDRLVVRKEDPADRRAHLIYVTPKAQAIRAELEALATKANEDLTSCLSQQEKVLLRDILKKILSSSVQQY